MISMAETSSLHLILSSNLESLDNALSNIHASFQIIYKEKRCFSFEFRQENYDRLFYDDIDKKIIFEKSRNLFCAVIEFQDGYKEVYDLLRKNKISCSFSEFDFLKKDIYISSSFQSFLFKGTILFGVSEMKRILNPDLRSSEKVILNEISLDLMGSNGWKDFKGLFKVLNYADSWVVLRNAEYLPNDFWNNDKDVDCLCRDKNSFVALSNAKQRFNGISSYFINIDGKEVDFDIRYLGDEYYDYFWEKEILDTSVFMNTIVPVPSPVNYFYSLIYHGLIHKKSGIKTIYLERLLKLSSTVFINFSEEKYKDYDYLRVLLTDFLQRKRFRVSIPLDTEVWFNLNRKVINEINLIYPGISFRAKLFLTLRKYKFFYIGKLVPKFISNKLKSIVKI
jgi:hypothetical protein